MKSCPYGWPVAGFLVSANSYVRDEEPSIAYVAVGSLLCVQLELSVPSPGRRHFVLPLVSVEVVKLVLPDQSVLLPVIEGPQAERPETHQQG